MTEIYLFILAYFGFLSLKNKYYLYETYIWKKEVAEGGRSMLTQILKQHYGVKVSEPIKLSRYDAFKSSKGLYIVVKGGNLTEEVIGELHLMAEHLHFQGDRFVSMFVPSKEGRLLSEWENEKLCVLVNRVLERPVQKKMGRKLAKFHYRGRSISSQIRNNSRVGQWKQLWEQRLEQIENVWNERIFQSPENDFERMFLESFPYFMGLTENAIQYLVDTELDDNPNINDNGTVCHERFSKQTWGDIYTVKNPFDWVFDHSSRDLAEWTREHYFQNKQIYQPDLNLFYADYQTISPLSSFSWRLLYSRLLFPLHYFECIEHYYITVSEQQKKLHEEKIEQLLRYSENMNNFSAAFSMLSKHRLENIKFQS